MALLLLDMAERERRRWTGYEPWPPWWARGTTVPSPRVLIPSRLARHTVYLQHDRLQERRPRLRRQRHLRLGRGQKRPLVPYAPTPTTFSRVIGLTDRSKTIEDGGLPKDPWLELYSGVNLRTGLENVLERLQDIPNLDEVTHVYYLGGSTLPEDEVFRSPNRDKCTFPRPL
jgi:hypothetical protein